MIAYSTAAQFTDVGIDKLVNAGLGTLGLIVVIIVLVTLGPTLLYLARRDTKRDQLAEKLIEQAGEDRKDNRRLLEIVAQGQADTSRLVEGLNRNTAHIEALELSDTQRIATDIVMVAKLTEVGKDVVAIPPLITETTELTSDGVKEAMTQAFEIRDERFQQLHSTLENVKEKVDKNEAVSVEIKEMLGEVLTILREAQPVTRPDTGSLAGRPDTGTDPNPLRVEVTNLPPLSDSTQEK